MESKLKKFFLFCCLAWYLIPNLLLPQDLKNSADLDSGQLQKIIIDDVWKFKSGDNREWANPHYDDSKWTTTIPGYFRNEEWESIGWLRFRVLIDTSLTDKLIGMLAEIQGAAEVYIDGRLRASYGKILETESESKQYAHGIQKTLILKIGGSTELINGYYQHLIAVRISSYRIEFPVLSFESEPFFNLMLDDVDSISDFTHDAVRVTTTHQMLLLGIFLAFSILHFFLYLSYPEMKANLFFTIITLSIAAIVLGRFEMIYVNDPAAFIWYFRMMNLSIFILLYSVIRLLNHLLGKNNRKANYLYTVIFIVLSILLLFNPYTLYSLVSLAIIIGFLEILRIIVAALYQKENIRYEGSWIILFGFIPICLVAGYELAVNLELSNEMFDYTKFPVVLYSMLFLVLSMSIFLSRNFAKVNASLKLQLEHVKLLSEKTLQQEVAQAKLEAENKRKSEELESARQLQLSMLPKELPDIENLNIEVKMSTATEVGGDYYDFIITGKNSFVGVFGDATGHGLQSGSVVTATKSLFKSLGKNNSPSQILTEISAALKQMGFEKLFMALTAFTINDKKLTIASGGMPFLLYYDSKQNRIVEVGSPGIPLGMMSNIDYKEDELNLNAGDTLLFMSDGYPELFNPEEEMLGYDRCRSLFESVAGDSAENIIEQLINYAGEWAGGKPPDDDITLMIIKCIK
jgi:serine phosphatase RsbU (regulator of sigma subunit)